MLTGESRVRVFEPHGRSWTNVPTSGADLPIGLASTASWADKQTDRNGRQAGRGWACRCGVKTGVLADTVLIGFPELVPNYRFCRRSQPHRLPGLVCRASRARGVDSQSSVVCVQYRTVLFHQHRTAPHRTAPHYRTQVHSVAALRLPFDCPSSVCVPLVATMPLNLQLLFLTSP
jgi:hypothetical protein